MRTFIANVVLLACVASGALAQPDSTKHEATYYLNLAYQAHAAQNYVEFLANSRKVFELRPNNPNAAYNLACSYALTGKSDSSLALLNRLADVGFDYGVAQDEDLKTIREGAAYDSLTMKIKRMKSPINHSKVAFVIGEKDLIPENIAYDPVTRTFYAGSLYRRKIVAVTPEGKGRDFTTEGQDGLWAVLGMKVDATRWVLWVVSSAENEMKDAKPEEFGKKTGVFKYDLGTGRLIKKYLVNDTAHWHLLNDLVLDSRGDVFISDTFGGSVWVIRADKDTLEPFVKPENLVGANGITLSTDERYLFVAYFSGIAVIDLSSKQAVDIAYRAPIALAYADGLYFYRGSLVAIQTDQHRVNRYYLSADYEGVDSVKVIEAYNPNFDYPTTGVLVDSTLYYIANSQYMSYDNGMLFPTEKLHEVVILRTEL